jgi:Telomeric single stranded DNA binding POT1/CDC13
MEGTGKNNSSISLNVTFLSGSLDNLPTFKKVGEIIRIHRCTIGTYNN